MDTSGVRHRLAERMKLFAARHGYLFLRYAGGENTARRKQWLERVLQVGAERHLLLHPAEACQLISSLEATKHLGGAVAEVGVAYGASAKLIAEFAAGRTVHLFDTFSGLPSPGDADSAKFAAGDFRSSLEQVREYLAGYAVVFHPGLFPETAAGIPPDTSFSFVHLDVDLYESTIACLRVFHPLLCRGGVILVHDYHSAAGVNRALQEFFADKHDPVIELSGYQALVVKL